MTLFLALSQRLNVYYAAPLAALTLLETARGPAGAGSRRRGARRGARARARASDGAGPARPSCAPCTCRARTSSPRSTGCARSCRTRSTPTTRACSVRRPFRRRSRGPPRSSRRGRSATSSSTRPSCRSSRTTSATAFSTRSASSSPTRRTRPSRSRGATACAGSSRPTSSPRMNDYASYLGRPPLLGAGRADPDARLLRDDAVAPLRLRRRGARSCRASRFRRSSHFRLLFHSQSAIRRGDRWIPRWSVFEISGELGPARATRHTRHAPAAFSAGVGGLERDRAELPRARRPAPRTRRSTPARQRRAEVGRLGRPQQQRRERRNADQRRDAPGPGRVGAAARAVRQTAKTVSARRQRAATARRPAPSSVPRFGATQPRARNQSEPVAAGHGHLERKVRRSSRSAARGPRPRRPRPQRRARARAASRGPTRSGAPRRRRRAAGTGCRGTSRRASSDSRTARRREPPSPATTNHQSARIRPLLHQRTKPGTTTAETARRGARRAPGRGGSASAIRGLGGPNPKSAASRERGVRRVRLARGGQDPRRAEADGVVAEQQAERHGRRERKRGEPPRRTGRRATRRREQRARPARPCTPRSPPSPRASPASAAARSPRTAARPRRAAARPRRGRAAPPSRRG